jgi:hypothetical protein
MCDQTTTNICNQLAAQANELRIVEQHEATIAAALALPEAERYRLWFLLGKQFDTELDFTPVYPESEWPADVTTGTTIWPSPRGRA